MKILPDGLKKTLNWSYERGSWQYDILCLLILAFIFLTPASLFEEKPGRELAGGPGSEDEGALVREVEASELKAFLERSGRSSMLGFPPEALSFYLQEQEQRPVRLLSYEVTGRAGGSPESLRYRVRIGQPTDAAVATSGRQPGEQ